MIFALLSLFFGGVPSPAPSTAPVFDVRSFGATPGDGQDDAPGVRRAVGAAVAAGGGRVYLPRGLWQIGGPIGVRDCSGVTIEGDGPATVLATSSYCGPVLAVGMPLATIDGWHRPPYFAPGASAPVKNLVATLGTHALSITGHPLQFGLVTNGQPDYWSGGGALTIDVMVSGKGWGDGSPLFGMVDPWQGPNPWAVWGSKNGVRFDFATDRGKFSVSVPCDPTQTPRLSLMVDFAGGRAAAWVNGQSIAVTGAPPAGSQMIPSDGITPFMVGYLGRRMDASKPGDITDLTLYGLRICRSAVYQWDGPRQTIALTPSIPVTDDSRCFSIFPGIVPTGTAVAWLSLDDGADGSPWVSANCAAGRGVMAWLPVINQGQAVGTDRITVKDLTIQGAMQPCVLTARHSRLTLSNVRAFNASQSFGALPLITGYPAYFERCEFSGFDAPIVLFSQMVESRGLVLAGVGRDGVRSSGGDGLWDGVKVWRVSPWTETIFRLIGQDDGLGHSIRKLMVDNEGGGVSRAFIEAEQGYYQRGQLVVDGLSASVVEPQSCLVRLIGHGAGNPYKVEARNLVSFGPCPTALHVTGPASWHGSFDASQLYPGAVLAETPVVSPGASPLGAIVVTPPTPLYKP